MSNPEAESKPAKWIQWYDNERVLESIEPLETSSQVKDEPSGRSLFDEVPREEKDHPLRLLAVAEINSKMCDRLTCNLFFRKLVFNCSHSNTTTEAPEDSIVLKQEEDVEESEEKSSVTEITELKTQTEDEEAKRSVKKDTIIPSEFHLDVNKAKKFGLVGDLYETVATSVNKRNFVPNWTDLDWKARECFAGWLVDMCVCGPNVHALMEAKLVSSKGKARKDGVPVALIDEALEPISNAKKSVKKSDDKNQGRKEILGEDRFFNRYYRVQTTNRIFVESFVSYGSYLQEEAIMNNLVMNSTPKSSASSSDVASSPLSSMTDNSSVKAAHRPVSLNRISVSTYSNTPTGTGNYSSAVPQSNLHMSKAMMYGMPSMTPGSLSSSVGSPISHQMIHPSSYFLGPQQFMPFGDFQQQQPGIPRISGNPPDTQTNQPRDGGQQYMNEMHHSAPLPDSDAEMDCDDYSNEVGPEGDGRFPQWGSQVPQGNYKMMGGPNVGYGFPHNMHYQSGQMMPPHNNPSMELDGSSLTKQQSDTFGHLSAGGYGQDYHDDMGFESFQQGDEPLPSRKPPKRAEEPVSSVPLRRSARTRKKRYSTDDESSTGDGKDNKEAAQNEVAPFSDGGIPARRPDFIGSIDQSACEKYKRYGVHGQTRTTDFRWYFLEGIDEIEQFSNSLSSSDNLESKLKSNLSHLLEKRSFEKRTALANIDIKFLENSKLARQAWAFVLHLAHSASVILTPLFHKQWLDKSIQWNQDAFNLLESSSSWESPTEEDWKFCVATCGSLMEEVLGFFTSSVMADNALWRRHSQIFQRGIKWITGTALDVLMEVAKREELEAKEDNKSPQSHSKIFGDSGIPLSWYDILPLMRLYQNIFLRWIVPPNLLEDLITVVSHEEFVSTFSGQSSYDLTNLPTIGSSYFCFKSGLADQFSRHSELFGESCFDSVSVLNDFHCIEEFEVDMIYYHSRGHGCKAKDSAKSDKSKIKKQNKAEDSDAPSDQEEALASVSTKQKKKITPASTVKSSNQSQATSTTKSKKHTSTVQTDMKKEAYIRIWGRIKPRIGAVPNSLQEFISKSPVSTRILVSGENTKDESSVEAERHVMIPISISSSTPEFLVPKEKVLRSIKTNWKKDDPFSMDFFGPSGKERYHGFVHDIVLSNPNDLWEAAEVKWSNEVGNTEVERVNIWELEDPTN
eukprot:GHVP01036925.1.p1 GENE.GHVP01036925.1~~GHVP01036925.1.p1  ORF type:complete len:1185 (+),score=285.49 GHVP01036925.1:578-4132(+)